MRLGEASRENPANNLSTGLMRLQVRLCPMPPMLLGALNTAVDRHLDQLIPVPCLLPCQPVCPWVRSLTAAQRKRRTGYHRALARLHHSSFRLAILPALQLFGLPCRF